MTAMSRCYPFRVRIKKTQSMILLVSCVIILINVMHKPYNIIRENLAFEIARCSACGYINKTTPFGNSSFTRLDVVDFINKTSFVSVIAILERIKQRLGRQRHYDETGKTVCGYPKEVAGYFAVDFNASLSYHGNTLFTDVKPGGIWTPSKCAAIQRTAVIIPYRDRERHLQTLLYYLVPMLKRQQIDFQIFVVEQYGRKVFNKGMLLNAGFLEAWRYGDFDCFIFHDVDLVPVNDKNMYTCEVYPKHMSPEIDIDNNELPYVMLVGGVLGMTPEMYIALNGYSNLYWGWGGEDDDMAFRMHESKLGVIRPPPTIGRYMMHMHGTREESKTRFKLLESVKEKFRGDGVNSVAYRLVFPKITNLYTHIMIDVGDPPHE